jgi:hypothetical protein
MPSCQLQLLVVVPVIVVVDFAVLSESSDMGRAVTAASVFVKVTYVVTVLVLVDSPALLDTESKLSRADEDDDSATTGVMRVRVDVGRKSSAAVLAACSTGNVVGAATIIENSLSRTPSTSSSARYLACRLGSSWPGIFT